jgi:putative endonuclease
MNLWRRLREWWKGRPVPENLRRGRLGEDAARRHLQAAGLEFLASNFRSPRGEIDLVFRDGEFLVFVEVKARSRNSWTRPAAAVNRRKRRLLSLTALDYVKSLKEPRVRIRFDIVEVLLDDGRVGEVRHLPAAFALEAPYRYG